MLETRSAGHSIRSQSAAESITRSDILVGVALVFIMLMGGFLRFQGQNWDDFTHLHPDERFLTDVASSLGVSFRSSEPNPIDQQTQLDNCRARYPDTNGAGGYFDAQCSLLNPHNVGKGLYVYGTLPLFMARGAGDLAVELSGNPVWNSYSVVHLVWRSLSALAEIGVILLVFLMGVHLHNKWVGLVAAALYAMTVFSIQQSHFGTADAMANFFTTLAVYFAIRVQRGGKLIDYGLFGLACAAALASRINLAPVAGLLVLAALVRMIPALDGSMIWREREKIILNNVAGLALAGALTLIFFRLWNPYAFTGPGIFGLIPNPRWLADLSQAQYLVSGAAEMPPNWQWVGRTPYLFPLNNMVTWGMGIALGLTGWFGWLWSGWRLVRAKPGAVQNILLFVWVLVYFGWLGRNWVSSMRYFLPMYPMLAVLAAWALVEIVKRSRSYPVRRALSWALVIGVIGFTTLWAVMFTDIYRHQLTRVAASHWVWESVCGDLCIEIEGAPEGTPLVNVAIANGYTNGSEDALVSQSSTHYSGVDFTYRFTAPADGVINEIRVPHLGNVADVPGETTVRTALIGAFSEAVLSEATLTDTFTRDNHPLGDAYAIALETPVNVIAGDEYVVQFQVLAGGPLITGGSVVSHEGAWDDSIPYSVCTLPVGVTLADDPPPGLLDADHCGGRNAWSGLLSGYEMQLAWEDEPIKRERILQALDNSDYLTISSNRFYDGVSRIPIRWPMSNAYYEALFNEQLGYDLVEVFQRTYELGPIKISDQYLPTYAAPEWLNEFEAEEAFHVYDHPVVFIFRKSADYDSQAVHDLLNGVPINRVNNAGFNPVPTCPEIYLRPGGGGCDTTLVDVATMSSLEGAVTPTQFQLTETSRETQYDGGTWSDLFDTSSPINTQPILTVVVWWLAIISFGWIVWPLLFVFFPSFADRGYAIAKLVGVFVTGWLAWYASSIGVPLWSRTGIGLIMAGLTLVSLLLIVRNGRAFGQYLRESWQRLMWIEVITLLAFLGFLLVRLSNPDLWHPSFGGEKPMDFAYFNGILRSTTFPPIDPWYAGGYINYYYFGFVIVGTPVLLLGVVPSIAYNLILPTLFAMTGIGAFSVAFNVVSHFRIRTTSAETSANWTRLGNPWVAGITALLLAAVLGNLDTPRVFGSGLAEMGGYSQPVSYQEYLVNEYTQENGAMPDDEALYNILNAADNPNIVDRVRYELSNSAALVSSLARGAGRLAGGDQLPIAANRWYWAPTRVLSEPPVESGNAIAEMPFFTFLYGDLHAHMIAMPLLLLVMAFVLNEVLLAGRDQRGRLGRFGALALGALTVGMLRATNTWDWPTFMVLSIAGLDFAWWLQWRRISRWSLASLAGRMGGFIVLSFLLSLPFITWYATVYGSINVWEGNKSPLWAYLDIHGLFLFLIASLLVWDTGRWLRSVYVRSFRGMWPILLSLLVGLVGIGLAVILVAAADYQVVLVSVPLLVWVTVLFFRQGQSREMQFVLALTGLALGLTTAVEFIVIGGDIGRQNTVFKFYIQAWLLFSVAGGAAVAWLFNGAPDWPGWLRNTWFTLAAILFTVAALYPIMGSRGKAVDRMSYDVPITLDGMEYMKYASQGENNVWFPLVDDYDMIRWLQENVEGTPVVMETQSWREYLWGGRVAIYTGMPSVLGWRFHQTQQRTMDALVQMVNQRRANINAFYATTDIPTAWEMLQFYDVSYVIVGALERSYFTTESLSKFDQMVSTGLLEKVYEQGQSTVYRVNQDATLTQVAGVVR